MDRSKLFAVLIGALVIAGVGPWAIWWVLEHILSEQRIEMIFGTLSYWKCFGVMLVGIVVVFLFVRSEIWNK